MFGLPGPGMSDWGLEIPGGFFDESKHLYRNPKGTIVPSTTQVFSILGMSEFDSVPKDVLEWKRNYGLAVHKAIELLMLDDLDWDSVDDAIIPAVTGLEMFLKKMEFVCDGAEVKMVHTLFGMEYGLTVDLKGTVLYHSKRRNAVIDLKSGVKCSPTWKWQLGGYVGAQAPGGWLGIVAQFDKEGEVVPHYVEVQSAQREFQVLLAAAILKLNNGLAKLGGSNGNNND